MRWTIVLMLLLAGCATDSGETTADGADDGAGNSDDPVGAGDEDTGAGGSAASEPTTHHVDIAGFKFDSADLTIAVGDTVIWTNQDSAPHTVDSTDGVALDSGNMANGATYSFTFTEAGTFAYRCDIHTSMTAKVTVA